MEELLYHYCSLDTFLKIIQNKTIRASDILKTNDYSETKWIVRSIKETIILKIKSNSALCKNLKIDDSNILYLSDMINQVVDGVYFNNSRNMFTFACCFSEVEDLLSQWRGYADNGNGVAIGFNKKIIETELSTHYSTEII